MQPKLIDDLTAERLRELLHYDESTGVFVWKQSRGSRAKAGTVAGRLNTTGSRQIEIAGRDYLARRLAWLYVFGEWPKEKIAPANGDQDDCRIDNLWPFSDFQFKPDGALTQAALKERLHYDPLTGLFQWLGREAGGNRIDPSIAGTESNGYWVIGIGGRSYRAHRLAFLYVTGQWPGPCVDHIDGDRLNNKWVNLRDATVHVNVQNQRRANVRNSTGLLGVTFRRKHFNAQISVDGKTLWLGKFDTKEEAHDCYVTAKRLMHEGCTI